MILCLTMIDDLPEVQLNLQKLAKAKSWEIKYINAPNENLLDQYALVTKVIFMNPNKSRIYFNRDFFRKFNKLEVFCTASTGTIHIDKIAAKEFDIKVITIKKYIEYLKTIPSTAELAFALSLDGLRKITYSHNDAVKKLSWNFEKYIGRQICDLKVGVIGYGRLGSIYSKMMKESGAELFILDPKITLNFNEQIEIFLSNCSTLDVLSIHIHAEGNINFFDKKFFNKLASNIVLINTSRGEIVNHADLLEFLDKNPNAMYCTDVIPEENNCRKRNNILTEFSKRKNIIVTQHIGGMSIGARKIAFGLASNLLLETYGVIDG